MAQKLAYYPQQQPQQKLTRVYPQSQPQNIYQQLGRPQPQPHLQEHPNYQQPSALVVQPQGGYSFSQQLPAQVQTSFSLGPGEAPHALPQSSYQLSQTPHVSPQISYPQSQTPYLPSQPPYTQSQASHPASQPPYTLSQYPYKQAQYPEQRQAQQLSHSQLEVSYVPQTPFISQTPAAVPTSSSGPSRRVSASWPPPVAPSATLAQQAQSQVQTQVQPQATSQTLALTPARRPLPQPFTGANATILPFASQLTDNPSSGSNRPFPTLAIQTSVAPSSNLSSSKRGRPLPLPTRTTGKQATMDLGMLPHVFSSSLAISAMSSQPQLQPNTTKQEPSPSKRPLHSPSFHSLVKKSECNKFSGLPSTIQVPKSILTTTLSSISTTSATTSNLTSVTSEPPPNKPTPIWKQTIPDHPPPAWGYAVGMVSKPYSKPKAKVPSPGSTNFIQSGVQKRYTYQQRQHAYDGHARPPASESQDEEHEEEETDSDEEDEEQPGLRYHSQNKLQKYTRHMASIASRAGVPSQALSRVYDRNFKEEMISTPKRKLKLKPKVKMNKMDSYTTYKNVNTINGHKSWIVPRRGRDEIPMLEQHQFRGHGRRARSAGGPICGGCNGSIIRRIVSAMGSKWHPACFCCTVCNEPLEHVSSYEHEGRPYCHLDYHENFAPRCYSCKTAIIEEQFISLEDSVLGKRTYHTQHFFCAECGDPFLVPSMSFPDSIGEVALSGDGEFEGFTVYKGHPYCETCHVRLRLPKCKRCKRSIRDHDEALEALGGKWCWGCFVCASCKEPFENPFFFQRGDKPFCEPCFSIM